MPIVVMTAGIITGERRIKLGSIQGVIAKPFLVEQIEALCASVGKGG
jgi:hypothetical protein